MRVAIVDDDPNMRTQLGEYFRRLEEELHVPMETVAFNSGDALLAVYQSEYAIIVFDVDMPGTNGIDSARRIREIDQQVVILFITNIAQYAINGYEVEAVDYVLKPIGYYDFALKLRRALRWVSQNQKNYLILDTPGGRVQVETDRICYVEVLDHDLIYHTLDGERRLRGSFRAIEPVLKEHHFSRCHKSFMVNLCHVQNIRSSEVVMDGVVVPLGRAYKESLMKDYIHYLHA